MKTVLRASEFLNDLISEKVEEYHDEYDVADFDESDTGDKIKGT